MNRFFKWMSTHKPSMTKSVVWFLLVNGVAWVWCSYYLAYTGSVEIAEALSKVVVTEILGVILVYSVKALFENLSKNNMFPDKCEYRSKDESEI